MKNLLKTFLTGAVILFGSHMAASAQVIYSDSFNRGSVLSPVALNGTETTYDPSGATWVAGTSSTPNDLTTDGASASTPDSGIAFLPLDVTAGNIYNVSANLTAISGNWVALGFAEGNGSSTSNTTTWLDIPGISAAPWLLLTPPVSTSGDNEVYPVGGPDAGNVLTSSAGVQGALYRITLNTEATDWVATYYEGSTQIGTFTYTGSAGANPNPPIMYVGFGVYAPTSGSVSNFTVSEGVVPEPSTRVLLLGALGILFLVQRLRARSV